MKKALEELMEEIRKEKLDGIAIVVASNKGKHRVPSQLNITLLGDITREQVISVATEMCSKA